MANPQITDRDRFAAFAFCWGEVLLELDPAKKIVFAGGATETMIGRNSGELHGVDFIDLVAPGHRVLVKELFAVADNLGRIDNASFQITGAGGTSMLVSCAGYRLDDLGAHLFLALRAGGGKIIHGHQMARNPETGLYGAEGFADLAGERLKTAQTRGEAAELTLVSVPKLGRLKARLDENRRDSLSTAFGAALRANSLGGDSAAEIEEGKYAIVRDAAISRRELENHLAELTREFDPESKGAAAETAAIDVGEGELNDEDLANGLIYAINLFRDAREAELNLRDFSKNLDNVVGEAMMSVQNFRKVLEDDNFDIAFHPILDVASGDIHHYEALVRFDGQTAGVSPDQYITFAEEVGLIWKFDIAMARKVIGWLSPRRNGGYSLAVNISGISIANLSYLAELHQLLKTNPWTRGKILFEVTESARIADLAAANRFFQRLRKEGYEVCLDDFGAGAASFQYLASLDVDVVKLDGLAVKNALAAKKGRAFLTALTQLCRDMGVETVAEMIDDDETFQFVRSCGIDYAQGYLFGEPSADITAFANAGQIPAFRGEG